MAIQKKGLGRGLDALLAENSVDEAGNESGVTSIRVFDVEPNKSQPRKSFDQTALEELAASVAEHGLIQPIIVRRKPNGFYEIIAGERRWRACKMAGLSSIPAIIKELSDKDAAFFSMIENLQREDLNPVEEARGYQSLIDGFGLTQEEAAAKVGKSRANVANLLRLLKLPENILSYVEDGRLSYGHARALIPLAQAISPETLKKHAEFIIKKELSVRETEAFVKSLFSAPAEPNDDDRVRASYFRSLEGRVSERLGRRVKLSDNALSIPYKGSDDLESMLAALCGRDIFTEE